MEDFIIDMIKSFQGTLKCVGNFELEEYDRAKVDDGHAEYFQVLMDHML